MSEGDPIRLRRRSRLSDVALDGSEMAPSHSKHVPTRIAIVVIEDGSADLSTLVRTQHVWVVDTPLNRAAAEKVWAARSAGDGYDLTTFTPDRSEKPDAWVAAIPSDRGRTSWLARGMVVRRRD